MNKIYIFCHGFGFNNTYWNNLSPYFHNKNCIYLDLGYFNQKNTFIDYNSNYSYIGIGHSLGLIKLLQTNIPFTHIIGLNGFINFLGNDIKLSRKRTLELKFLTQSFIDNESTTLQNFHKRCGYNIPITFKNLNKDQLLKDLASLKLSYQLPNTIKTFIIGSENDIIVPKALVNDNFNNLSYVKQVFLKDTKHIIGIEKPKEIYSLIIDFLHG